MFHFDDREVTMYRVLRTVSEEGQLLTDQPVAPRLVGNGYENYADALANAKALRTGAYQHKVTGEVRVYSELQTTGAAYRDNDEEAVKVWRFVKASNFLGGRGYALPVEDTSLHLYEPKANQA